MEQLFFKGLALNFLIAFWSLHFQVIGLFGAHGIEPISLFLEKIKSFYKKTPYTEFPTLFWLSATDLTLKLATMSGIILSLAALLVPLQPIAFFLLWVLYLSFVTTGQTFLSYQWDCLLVETGLIACLFSLFPSPFFLLLLWLLLFRLIFSSGIRKLTHGSKEWLNLTAMHYHYFTQPLPNRVSYFFHQQPMWFAKFSTLMVYFFEVAAPLMIFGPWEMRAVACFFQVVLQILILLTGNFAFFNTLTLALCASLLLEWDKVDATLTGAILALPLIGLNLVLIADLFFPVRRWFRPIFRSVTPWFIANGYGLFVHMTTWRNEIEIEGSDDGETFIPYRFFYKPQELASAPRQIAPFQPRVDWQMWFAALSNWRQETWLQNFIVRLLQGEKSVLKLLKENPFPQKPPKFIRARVWRYTFTSLKEKKKTGNWWKKELVGNYCPQVGLNQSEAS